MIAASISVAPVVCLRPTSSRRVIFSMAVAPVPSVRFLALDAVVRLLRLLQAVGRVLHRLVLLLLVVLLLALGFGFLLRALALALRAVLVELVLALFLFEALAAQLGLLLRRPLVGNG